MSAEGGHGKYAPAIQGGEAVMGSAAPVGFPPGRRSTARQRTNSGEPRCRLPAYSRVAAAAWVMSAATAAGWDR